MSKTWHLNGFHGSTQIIKEEEKQIPQSFLWWSDHDGMVNAFSTTSWRIQAFISKPYIQSKTAMYDEASVRSNGHAKEAYNRCLPEYAGGIMTEADGGLN